MTIAVDLGHKARKQAKQKTIKKANNTSCDRLAMAFRDTIRVSYSLDPDQDRPGVCVCGGGDLIRIAYWHLFSLSVNYHCPSFFFSVKNTQDSVSGKIWN